MTVFMETNNICRDMPVDCSGFGFLSMLLFLTSVFNLLGLAFLRYAVSDSVLRQKFHLDKKMIFYLVLFYKNRCCALYFPEKVDDKSFQYARKIVPLSGWVLSFAVFSPTLSDKSGQFGVECKSLLCRWIMIDEENKPTNYDPEKPGLILVLICAVFMVVLNVATYIKVSVIL